MYADRLCYTMIFFHQDGRSIVSGIILRSDIMTAYRWEIIYLQREIVPLNCFGNMKKKS